jgi:hypothetical protein
MHIYRREMNEDLSSSHKPLEMRRVPAIAAPTPQVHHKQALVEIKIFLEI